MRKFNPIGTKNQYIYFAVNPKSRTFANRNAPFPGAKYATTAWGLIVQWIE